MRAKSLQAGKERKGVILLVVLAMITLLTILGITFVLYSDSSEATARINLESEKIYQPEYTANELMQIAFGQLVFDVEDDVMGQQSAMRGHSLARDMYGYRYDDSTGPSSPDNNDRPFRGTGRFADDPNRQYINYTTFYSKSGSSIKPVRIMDPERPGIRVESFPGSGVFLSQSYAGGANPPYTYPDLNHVFLAKFDPSTGQVLEPSFVRRETMGITAPAAGPLSASATAWTDGDGAFRMIRPRSGLGNEHPGFPAPTDEYGDVRNLPWGTRNDSVWIDLGVEPKTAPNGKKYKPLFAFTVLDLDGRANLNVHGNAQGDGGSHSSRNGVGPWEVNLTKALSHSDPTLNAPLSMATTVVNNRLANVPSKLNAFQYFLFPYGQGFTAPLDLNAKAEVVGGTNSPLYLPGSFAGSLSPFALFVSSIYGGGGTNEWSVSNLPALENLPYSNDQLAKFSAPMLRNRNGFSNTALGTAISSNPSTMTPFSSSRPPVLNRFTTLSWDLDRPGMVPYIGDRATQPLTLTGTGYTGAQFIPGQQFPSRDKSSMSFPTSSTGLSLDGDFGDNKYQFFGRYKNFDGLEKSVFKRLNMNRVLPDFPQVDPATGVFKNWPDATAKALVNAAQSARSQFAQDIFLHLCLATGALMPTDSGWAAATPPQKNATGWMAQLAVNLVDNIDTDDVMTSMAWDTNKTVFGVEASRLAINEIYPQIENGMNDFMTASSKKEPNSDFDLSVYVELHNPMPVAPNVPGLPAYLRSDKNPMSMQPQNVHVLELVESSVFTDGLISNLTNISSISPQVIVGDLTFSLARTNWKTHDLSLRQPDPTANPDYYKAREDKGTQDGYLVVGPKPESKSELGGMSRLSKTNDFVEDAGLVLPSFIDKSTTTIGPGLNKKMPVVLLRRLANPMLPPQADPDPAKGFYNPYITIDFAPVTTTMLAGNDARILVKNTSKNGPNNDDYKKPEQRVSYNRPQPFYGVSWNPQRAPSEWKTTDAIPATTFWRYNGKTDGFPATTYVAPGSDTFETPRLRQHLDRQPVNMGELLTTPTCRTHEILFYNNERAEYCAGWTSPETGLYRFLELAHAGQTPTLGRVDNSSGSSVFAGLANIWPEGGRLPGKINLNTTSLEVFQALCDDNLGSTTRFSSIQIQNIWGNLQNHIKNYGPLWGFGVGESPVPKDYLSSFRGMHQTLLSRHSQDSFNPISSSDTTDQLNLLFDPQNCWNNGGAKSTPPGTARSSAGDSIELPPHVRQELISKILNQTTTRSNCFAVWLTVGFFEVKTENWDPNGPATTVKYTLGGELQPASRRRFFGLIDRTQLETWRTTFPAGTSTITGQIPLASIGLGSSFFSPLTGKTYPINAYTPPVPGVGGGPPSPAKPATILTIAPGTDLEETVEVENILGMGPAIRLKNTHTGTIVICNRGNPGPIPREKVDLDDFQRQGLIPYFQVLE